MSAPTTIERSFAEQHAFNRQVWERLVNDPSLNDVLEKVETDRDGNLIMGPPPTDSHIVRQNLIAKTLDRLRPEGLSLVDGTVSTLEGTKIPDTVWYGETRVAARASATDTTLSQVTPNLCVEVLSPSDSESDIEGKIVAYFNVDVREVWGCDLQGNMTFHGPKGIMERSEICPEFPRYIPATWP
jgi:Uma2 family endonuclease